MQMSNVMAKDQIFRLQTMQLQIRANMFKSSANIIRIIA
jgi:hypothetical protein